MRLFSAIVFLFLPLLSQAQKFGYVDSQYILEQMAEYQEAKSQIDEISVAWQKEIEGKMAEVESMHAQLKAEEVLLTQEMYEARLLIIEEAEQELKNYQHKVFGFEGLFFLKQQELMQPVQAKVYEAIEAVCRAQRLAIMFDKASELVMLFTDPTHDYTDMVLDELGLGEKSDQIE